LSSSDFANSGGGDGGTLFFEPVAIDLLRESGLMTWVFKPQAATWGFLLFGLKRWNKTFPDPS
jgi:hypothetical protein